MKLIDINFNKDKKSIYAAYEEEREDGLYSHYFQVPIQLYPAGPMIQKDIFDEFMYYPTIDFGFGRIEANGDIIRESRLVMPKVQKMTVKDIERELGYKVEIISEEKE